MWWRRSAKREIARQVREELECHFSMRVEEGLAHGLSPAEAVRNAEKRFGHVAPVLRRSSRIRGRAESWRRAWLTDLVEAWRLLRRSPSGAIASVAVLATGICTALAAFTVADALTARPVAGADRPSQLHLVLDSYRQGHPGLMTFHTVTAIERDASDLAFFAWGTRTLQVRVNAAGGLLNGDLVTARYFSILGAAPAAGRLLGPGDARAANRAAVLSARAAARLGLSHADIGAAISVNGQPFDLVGIAGRAFEGIDATQPTEIWLPIETEPVVSKTRVFPDGSIVRGYITRNIGWMYGGARLPHGTRATDVEQRLTSLLRGLDAKLPERRAIVRQNIHESGFAGTRETRHALAKPLLVLAVLLVILTAACLSTLLFARFSRRQADFRIRLAIGASLGRLIRLAAFQVLTLTAAGTAIGLSAYWMLIQWMSRTQLLPGITVGDLVRRVDLRTLAVLLAFATIVALVSLAGPILLIARTRATQLAATRVTVPGRRLRVVLMAAQVAVGCTLLTGSLLMTRSLWSLQSQPLGFDADAVAFAEVDPGTAGLTDSERLALATRALSIPGMRTAIADHVPFVESSSLIASDAGAAKPKPVAIPATRVGGPYFETLGLRIVAGRGFEPSDQTRPVLIVSEPLAEYWWPGQAAVGREITIGRTNYAVVGVVSGARDLSLRGKPTSRLYLPYGVDTEVLSVVARTNSTTDAGRIARELEALDPRVVVNRSGLLTSLVRRSIEQRLLFRAFTLIGGIGALFLVVAGVWGLSQSTLTSRWRELGIRQALGASRKRTIAFVYREAIVIGIVGCAAGSWGGYQLGRAMSWMLHATQPGDALSLSIVSATVLAATLGGALLPARRALSVDVASLLRSH